MGLFPPDALGLKSNLTYSLGISAQAAVPHFLRMLLTTEKRRWSPNPRLAGQRTCGRRQKPPRGRFVWGLFRPEAAACGCDLRERTTLHRLLSNSWCSAVFTTRISDSGTNTCLQHLNYGLLVTAKPSYAAPSTGQSHFAAILLEKPGKQQILPPYRFTACSAQTTAAPQPSDARPGLNPSQQPPKPGCNPSKFYQGQELQRDAVWVTHGSMSQICHYRCSFPAPEGATRAATKNRDGGDCCGISE